MTRLKQYRRFLITLLAVDLVVLSLVFYYDVKGQIPDDYYTFVDTNDALELSLPVVIEGSVPALSINNAGTSFRVESRKKGEYQVDVRLFGLISMKKMNVHVWEKTKIAPCGSPIGIYVATKGLLVLDTGVVEGKDDVSYEPAGNIFRPGDYILQWNGKQVTSTAHMNDLVKGSKGKPAKVLIRRNHEKIQVRVTPVMSKKGDYKIGVWVREDTQGIGTMTYITESGGFGALGHGITDSDTGTMIRMSHGEIYGAKILNIVKGKSRVPGELEGIISMTNRQKMGTIKKNTSLGIYWSVTESIRNRLADQFIEIAMKQKIKKGTAYLLTRIEGVKKEYKIEIMDIKLTSKDNKGMVVKVTDPELLRKTGGIVQGMFWSYNSINTGNPHN